MELVVAHAELGAVAEDAGSDAHASPRAEPTLVERVARGDVGALAAVYDLHHARVRSFAQRLVGDVGAAEDLLQETFIKLPSLIRRLQRESALLDFLVAVTINHARHHIRAAARRRRAYDRLKREPVAAVIGPDHRLSRRELAAALLRALDKLPVDQRVAFVLLEVEERSSREAASLLRVPEATLRTRLFHARRKLRTYMAEDGYDGHE